MRRLVLCLAALAALLPAAPAGEEILVCGFDEVFALDIDPRKGTVGARTWSWLPAQSQSLPAALRGSFATTDECKPVRDGKSVLVTASSGGVALVERANGAVPFHAKVGNAHSASLLPGNRVVVCGSLGNDRLVLFDEARPGVEVFSTPLRSAHGAVWDEGRSRLWALGHDTLFAFGLEAWESPQPSLKKLAGYRLPDADGHDLTPIPGTRRLLVTTGKQVWTFDPDSAAFRAHPVLGGRATVKSAQVHPATGQVLYVQATESWWSPEIRLAAPDFSLKVAGENVYKARWLAAENPTRVRNPVTPPAGMSRSASWNLAGRRLPAAVTGPVTPAQAWMSGSTENRRLP